MRVNTADEESGKGPRSVPHWRLLIDQALVTPEVVEWDYDGSGTEDDPFIVTFIDNDPRNPMLFSKTYKWTLSMTMAVATLAVSFCSSAFSGGVREIIMEYHASQEVVTLGLSLFVLGFAVGPLFFAPLSELFGRQILFFATFGLFTAFLCGVCGAQNIESVIILRFFAGVFGSSPLTNAGGVIADLFSTRERGVVMSIFSAAPFMGPVIGPIAGGFLGEAAGWRWLQGLLAAYTGLLWIIGSLVVPETYPLRILRKRAAKLSKITGKVYRSKAEIDQGPISIKESFRTSLLRPWVLLFREPIVLILSIYMAIVYGTLYLLFGAYPIVYQEYRHWSQGIGGLAFVGVAIGMAFSILYTIFIDNKRYLRVTKKAGGVAPPEARLPPAIIGGAALPIGLFWFAWTNSPKIHWAVSIAAGIPFGFGMVLVFLSIMNYLIDAYTIFAASVLAASSVLRSAFGAAFPLFTSYMYEDLGIHWASSIPAFLALACVPFPFLFYKYGTPIRLRCKYACEAAAFMERIRSQQQEGNEEDSAGAEDSPEFPATVSDHEKPDDEKDRGDTAGPETLPIERETPEPHLEPIKPGRTLHRRKTIQEEYEEMNPYDIDRVHTHDSFGPPRSRSTASIQSGKKSLRSTKSERK